MRDQYAGDISDLLKLALLRALAKDRSLGIAWYYNALHDGRPDGRHIEYLSEQRWSEFDPALMTALRSLTQRSVSALEQLPIWPEQIRFHRDPLPRATGRKEWAAAMNQALGGCRLVFLDPDNGLGETTLRHATFEEVKLLRRPGERALVLIKFPGRESFGAQEARYHDHLRTKTGVEHLLTMRTSVTVPAKNGAVAPRFRWFTLLDPDDELAARFDVFANQLSRIRNVNAVISDGASPHPRAALDPASGTLPEVPTFPGTDIPLRTLFDTLEAGLTINEFVIRFPSITRKSALQTLQRARDAILRRSTF
jgi:hypothetical protein